MEECTCSSRESARPPRPAAQIDIKLRRQADAPSGSHLGEQRTGLHRFPATDGERRGVDILDGPRGEHVGGRNAATLAMLTDRLQSFRIEVFSMRAPSLSPGSAYDGAAIMSENRLLVLIDAKTPVRHVGARSATCGKVVSEKPRDRPTPRQSVSYRHRRRSPVSRSGGHSASSLAFRASMLERPQPKEAGRRRGCATNRRVFAVCGQP